jgi:hypothetical protein
MSAAKWEKRYRQQVDGNNLLSDKLRQTRAAIRERETELLKYIKDLKADNQQLLSEVLVLKSTLLEAGVEPEDDGE